jgi:hypothetical protein
LVFLGITFAVRMVAPGALRPIDRILSRAINIILMAVVFYGVFTPVAALMRLVGRDSLGIHPDPGAETYWKSRTPPGPPATTMENPF